MSMGDDDLGQGHTAVVFDLWGTLVPFPKSAWDIVLARIASALGTGLNDFLPAWHADYAERAVGDLESSLRRVCQLAGVIADDTHIQRVLEIRRVALAAMFLPRPAGAGLPNRSPHQLHVGDPAVVAGLSALAAR